METSDNYGGFIVSKNVLSGIPIRFSFREESAIPQLNGWTIYSNDDNDEYVSNSKNFVILGSKSIYQIAPVMLEIFDAPYGTDLCWLYEQDVHIGFYDLNSKREVTIGEILQKQG